MYVFRCSQSFDDKRLQHFILKIQNSNFRIKFCLPLSIGIIKFYRLLS